MKRLELIDLEWKVKERAALINMPLNRLPTFGDDLRDAMDSKPFVMYENVGYIFLVFERGKKIHERHTKDPEEIFFWILDGVTLGPAFEYAAKLSLPGDHRIYAFKKILELLEIAGVQDKFIEQLKTEYNSLLGFKLFDI